MTTKQNWFETLYLALESENLTDKWEFGRNIAYAENVRIISEDGTLISIFRNNNGLYERPIHYSTI